MHRHRRLIVGWTIGFLIVMGCAAFRESPEDQQISRAVKAALAADPRPMLTQVTVDTRRGVVTLIGWGDDATAERARQITRSVAGVRSVVDQIVVRDRLR
jgi:osmotically-inducible protein OsmY